MFGKFIFEKMNETDVRENIVSPLLKEMQYKHSSQNDVITEQTLRYPKSYIGRKKKNDPILRGKADYILEVDGRIRWVIEVKAPSVEIGPDDIDQAYSYAFHPEVRGIYFVVTNGREFRVFRTVDGPNVPPILTFKYADLNETFHSFLNILSPESLKRDYQDFILDAGKPLAPGFRSFAKIDFGKITYSDNSLDHAPFKGMNVFVSEGALQRLDGGGIVAFLQTESPFQSLQEINQMLGLESFDMFTSDEVISSNPSNPTVFLNEVSCEIPKGMSLFNFTTGGYIVAPVNMTIKTHTEASGYLAGNIFSGDFRLNMSLSAMPIPIIMSGAFEIKIG